MARAGTGRHGNHVAGVSCEASCTIGAAPRSGDWAIGGKPLSTADVKALAATPATQSG